MSIKLGVVMDPIEDIAFYKDTTLAMLLGAQQKSWELYYFTQSSLCQINDKPMGYGCKLEVFDNEDKWFSKQESTLINLGELDIILMRQDPPVNDAYLYTTYILEQAQRAGVLVVNNPRSVRECNEKLFATQFPQCITDTLVSANHQQLKDFIKETKDVICKPLNGLGGRSIFRVTANDPNINVILENLTQYGSQMIMAQRFIPEISKGDKRILIIDGIAIPFALARIPAQGETRGNLDAGGKGIAQSLTKRDLWIIDQIAPVLREKGLYVVGIDVIGDYLTEINVTSPLGIRELNAQCSLNIADDIMTTLEARL